MDAARKKRLKLEAFCRYHYGLKIDEVKRMSAAELKAFNEVWQDERKFWVEFGEKLVARINLMAYMLNVPQKDRRIRYADKLMWLGERPNGSVLDLTTKEGQEMFVKQMQSMVRKQKNGK